VGCSLLSLKVERRLKGQTGQTDSLTGDSRATYTAPQMMAAMTERDCWVAAKFEVVPERKQKFTRAAHSTDPPFSFLYAGRLFGLLR
jgi:hypothetical protein